MRLIDHATADKDPKAAKALQDSTIAPVRQVTPFTSSPRGADVPKWWAWSMFDYNGVTTAANMFATPPDGKGNRALLGMTGGYEANLDQALYDYIGAIRK